MIVNCYSYRRAFLALHFVAKIVGMLLVYVFLPSTKNTPCNWDQAPLHFFFSKVASTFSLIQGFLESYEKTVPGFDDYCFHIVVYSNIFYIPVQ